MAEEGDRRGNLAADATVIKLIHVYGQEAWHDDVCIYANTPALLALRAAIDKALAQGYGETEDVFAADGEGYRICVVRNDAPWTDRTWAKAALPYAHEIAAAPNNSSDRIWPCMGVPAPKKGG